MKKSILVLLCSMFTGSAFAGVVSLTEEGKKYDLPDCGGKVKFDVLSESALKITFSKVKNCKSYEIFINSEDGRSKSGTLDRSGSETVFKSDLIDGLEDLRILLKSETGSNTDSIYVPVSVLE